MSEAADSSSSSQSDSANRPGGVDQSDGVDRSEGTESSDDTGRVDGADRRDAADAPDSTNRSDDVGAAGIEGGRMWGGRFAAETDGAAAAFNASIATDRRLYREDIAGSIAHARMLGRAGYLQPQEVESLVTGLKTVRREIEAGELELRAELEDIHTHVEQRLVALVGEVGEKLQMGRSRNDQVACDLRLYLKKAIRRLQRQLVALIEALLDVAADQLQTPMPGYTHLQKAQPVTVGHHLTAYAVQLQRDLQRLDGAYERTDILPLGAGALAATPLDTDPQSVAEALGFSRVTLNSMDAVADRDFAVEFLAAAALLMVHLSRLSADLILWSSQAFGYVELDEADTTGSSLMPQKKNPDVAELTRGKAGSVIGDLITLLTVLKGLPMAYQKDLQEDKRAVFHTVDTLDSVLTVYPPMIERLTVDSERIAADTEADFLTATDYADYLVEHGVPFRRAHTIVGRLVRYCLTEDLALAEVPLEKLKAFSPAFGADVARLADIEASLGRRRTAGGPAPKAVAGSIDTIRQRLRDWQTDSDGQDSQLRERPE